MATAEIANTTSSFYPDVMSVEGVQDIHLKMACADDIPDFIRALAGNEQHLADLGSVRIEDITEESLRAASSGPDDDDFVRYRIMNPQGIIGSISLRGFEPQLRSVKLGGWVSKEHEGSGYVTACAQQLVQYTFKETDVELIKAEVDPNNTRSEEVVKRLGGRLTEKVVMEKKADGRNRPQRVWEIHKS